MDGILKQISDQKNFDAFIESNMKLSTYVPLWKNEVSTVEYSETGNFSTYTADYAAAIMGSIIEKNAGKPLQEMPNLGQLTGSIVRMGDRWQLDDDRLLTLRRMEGRLRDRQTNFTEEVKLSKWLDIVKFLFEPYELAAITPHKRMDSLLFEGLSNGTYTVNIQNNPNGTVYTSALDLGVRNTGVKITWNAGNAATMDGIGDMRTAVKLIEGATGKKVVKVRMTENTFDHLAFSAQFNNAVKLSLGNMTVDPVGMLSLENVNRYLTGLRLPPIQIEYAPIAQPDGTVVNAFQDNRVTFQLTDKVTKMIVSDPLELMDPHPNKVYTSFEDNLIASYRTENGRFIENEMWALPVFTGNRDLLIMKTNVANS